MRLSSSLKLCISGLAALALCGCTTATAGATQPLPRSSLIVGRSGPGTYPAGPCRDRKGTAATPFAGQPLPDPRCTPGAVNPAVTQADIRTTICARGWTTKVRPPESYTEPLKVVALRVYGQTGYLSAYELDHLIPLELGGAPWDPRNLWPEPDNHPSGYYLNSKDEVEDQLREAVCDGRVGLNAARAAIATNWETAESKLGVRSGG